MSAFELGDEGGGDRPCDSCIVDELQVGEEAKSFTNGSESEDEEEEEGNDR